MDKVVLKHGSTSAVARGDPRRASALSDASSATARSGVIASNNYETLINKPSIGGTVLVGALALSDIADAGANIEIGEREVAAPELTAAQVAALLTDD